MVFPRYTTDADGYLEGRNLDDGEEEGAFLIDVENEEELITRYGPDAIIEPNEEIILVNSDPAFLASSQGPQAANWALDRLDQRFGMDGFFNPLFTGEGVDVYVMDTGINNISIEFDDRLEGGFSGLDDLPDPLGDCHGHGTSMASLVGGNTWGVAKEVTLWPVKVMDCRGIGNLWSVTRAVDWLTVKIKQRPNRVAIILAAFSSPKFRGLELLIRRLNRAGGFVVTSAGNHREDACNTSPAGLKGAMTIGALQKDDSIHSTSNFGSCVDFYMPGVDITAIEDDSLIPKTLSGTSPAAALFAGVFSTYAQQHRLLALNDRPEFVDKIKGYGQPIKTASDMDCDGVVENGYFLQVQTPKQQDHKCDHWLFGSGESDYPYWNLTTGIFRESFTLRNDLDYIGLELTVSTHVFPQGLPVSKCALKTPEAIWISFTDEGLVMKNNEEVLSRFTPPLTDIAMVRIAGKLAFTVNADSDESTFIDWPRKGPVFVSTTDLVYVGTDCV